LVRDPPHAHGRTPSTQGSYGLGRAALRSPHRPTKPGQRPRGGAPGVAHTMSSLHDDGSEAAEERAMLRRLFDEIDIDGSRTLERDEIAQLAAKLHAQLSPADLDLAMSQVRCRSHFNLARLVSMQLPVTSMATAMRCPSGLAPHPTRCVGTVRAALLRGAVSALAPRS
jgi:hypothetical protein